MTARRRLWAETVPLREVAGPTVVRLLRRGADRGIALELALAVRATDGDALPDVVARLRGEGIPVSLWPMLDDDDGRWANATNVGLYGAFVTDLRRRLGPELAAACGLVVDLEPPFAILKAVTEWRPVPPWAWRWRPRSAPAAASRAPSFDDAVAGFVAIVREQGAARPAAATALPPVLVDDPARPFFQRLLGTPVDGVPFGRVDVMLYSSLVEGWSRGLLRRGDVRALLARACDEAVGRFGDRASVSLGVVGVGAFGDEPTYRDPRELADDVAVARASGIDDLSLFDLGGLLARPPAEAWLDAFLGGGAASSPKGRLADGRPRATARSALAWGALRAAARVGGRLLGA